ncbi:MAG: hypothetical protein HC919_08860 [Oscillatoriales cyanobacterium SM2_2_1]|nr:hypothetical protein [Oscillatoriales cyanobacterium SM2_2_1]
MKKSSAWVLMSLLTPWMLPRTSAHPPPVVQSPASPDAKVPEVPKPKVVATTSVLCEMAGRSPK